MMRPLDYENRIAAYLNKLNAMRRTVLESINEVRMLDLMDSGENGQRVGYGRRFHVLDDCSDWPIFSCEDTWGGRDYHAIFAFTVTIKNEMEGRTIGVSLDTGATNIWNTDNPQIMVYINGILTCAMDMNHNEVILSDSAQVGEAYDIRLYAYVNSPDKSNFLRLRVFASEPEAEALYYDMKLPLEAAQAMRPEDERREKLLTILNEAGDIIDFRDSSEAAMASMKAAGGWLRRNLYEKDWGESPTVYAIGHTHIDVAWKWPLRQTREKAVRSFSTVLYLMKRYPEYKFFLSQPQLYEFVKEDAPEIFEQVKERVREGRWEADGAMWLEADCNLTSGESLIRQIIYGKRFFSEELGIDEQQILWLPDAFGFLGALPQIMKKSGIKYFLTTKMGWNDADQQPDDLFWWEGVDGSRVLGIYVTTKDYEAYPEHFKKPVREVTYNGRQNASQIMGTWQNCRNRRESSAAVTVYGYGDGGGGPTQGMLEESRRLKYGIPGVPKVRLTGVKEYLAQLDRELDGKELNTWYGDLYLEYHRATFSSIAENKKNNRQCEYRNQEAEWLAALAWWQSGEAELYPQEKLDEAWRLLLLNQFHDILPGSAIDEVYEQSDLDYARIGELDAEITADALDALAAKSEAEDNRITVWNPLGFSAVVLTELGEDLCSKIEHIDGALSEQRMSDGRYLFTAKLPAKGCKSFRLGEERRAEKKAEYAFKLKSENSLETPWYIVSWNAKGELMSLYDKQAARELFRGERPGNRITVYEDIPKDYDCWNTESYYDRKHWSFDAVRECSLVEVGDVCAVLHTELSYRSSSLKQDMIFYVHSRRIDFKSELDWNEHQQLVKAEFDLDIMTRTAACEIPYGVIERPTHRNTSWQRAQFETCVHRFVDLSETNYGATLLNDSRYGYSVRDCSIGLTLLTSGIYPHTNADNGKHSFTYSLMPHIGSWQSAGVVNEAWLLNEKPIATAKIPSICIEGEYSMCSSSAQNVIITAVKRSEDRKGLVIRLYESCGQRTLTDIELSALAPEAVYECDLSEKTQERLLYDGRKVSIELRPYEIKTLLIFAQANA